ncbi:hypothetical protein EDD16DRAFT_1643113 [Pisolithus croceorrhizus]|nr:hypothetical protein EDD16DRAFT_1643113 [Pisolithus croceorrhizus]KAI6130979.1 hypothetical protein EV401DRAFT_1921694 [Pisolithus croceorrhizus]
MPLPCVLLIFATAGNLQTSGEMTLALVRTIARASMEQLEDNWVVKTDVAIAAHQGRKMVAFSVPPDQGNLDIHSWTQS